MSMQRYAQAISGCELTRRIGRVTRFYGLVLEASGPDAFLGEVCEVHSRSHAAPVLAEVVGLRDGTVLLMPYGELRGIALGSEVIARGQSLRVPAGAAFLGRVVDAFCKPLDGQPAPRPDAMISLRREAINPLHRPPIRQVLESGVRAIDTLLTMGKGQRIGIFSGSGVGKSTLLGMLARNVRSDVNVIALVGERGREVVEFLEQALTAEGLARSVVVVATSDRSAMERIRAANVATAMAEGFCRQGRQVALLVDSVTRYARAVRELGLAMGEPPVRKGFTPSLFVELPRLLERSGRMREGAITAFYTVLLEEDDDLDPVGEEVRSILDGHIRLSRRLAERGRYPAVDVAGSISRLFHRLASPDHKGWSARVRSWLGKLEDTEFLRQVGEYHSGGDPEADLAIARADRLERFLGQAPEEGARWEETLGGLAALAEAPC
jgi:FliI/YscN family ATPase